MNTMKVALAFSDSDSTTRFAASHPGVLFTSTSLKTDHLPFAALFVCSTDDLDQALSQGDVGAYLVCERTIANKPLGDLSGEELPGSVGIFPMVANPDLGPKASDVHWRDRHAPLALEIHTPMTHYYQLSIQHRFHGPEWHGIALCCCATEDDLRNHFYNSKDGERRIFEDVSYFADTKRSPRRVIANVSVSS